MNEIQARVKELRQANSSETGLEPEQPLLASAQKVEGMIAPWLHCYSPKPIV